MSKIFLSEDYDYIKDIIMKRLGYPLYKVEINDAQLELCVADAINIYLDHTKSWVKEYAFARAQEVVGTIRTSYQGTQSLNGDAMPCIKVKEEGKAKQEKMLKGLYIGNEENEEN